MTASTVHPAVAPVIEALNTLANYQPTSAPDLADVLKTVHDMYGETVIDALAVALRKLAGRTPTPQVTGHLNEAADKLYALGADEIDRAREATGHYNGTAGTDSYL